MDELVLVESSGGTPLARSRRFTRHYVPRALGLRPAVALAEGPASEELLQREGSYRRILALADMFVAAAVLFFVVHLLAGAEVNLAMLVTLPLIIVVNKVCGLYERDELVLKKSTLDEVPMLLQIAGLFALIVWLIHDGLGETSLEARHVVLIWVSTFLALIAARTAARGIAARASATERCLVVGDQGAIDTVARKLSGSRVKAEVIAGLPLNERRPSLDQGRFREMVRAHRIERVIIAPVSTDAADTLELIRLVKSVGVRVSLLPRLLEVVGSSVEFDHVDGLTMLGVRRFGLTRSSRTTKRAFDLLGSTLGLIAAVPLFVLAVLAIRLDSRGPVFFRQTRVGRDGEHFEILKFRSMCVDAEERKAELRHLNETSGLFKIESDPRITRAGAFLRKICLDELPQLINVWRGDMSLVGPRPLVLDEDALVAGFDRSRLALTPGMTGHWQILGSARIPMEEMVGIDYLYIANWSLWTDLKILLRTIPHVLVRGGM
jgi:exopolysaccharide biosynthesis polyprenyl glycosylphosphotransferase